MPDEEPITVQDIGSFERRRGDQLSSVSINLNPALRVHVEYMAGRRVLDTWSGGGGGGGGAVEGGDDGTRSVISRIRRVQRGRKVSKSAYRRRVSLVDCEVDAGVGGGRRNATDLLIEEVSGGGVGGD